MSVEITYRLDLLQVDLRSFLASASNLLVHEAARRATKSREVLMVYLSPHGRESGLRITGNFCLWNLGSRKRLLVESGILLTTGIRTPSSTDKVGSGIQGVDSRIQVYLGFSYMKPYLNTE